MALDLSASKVANQETSSSTKFDALVQAVQDSFNAIGDTSKMAWSAGQIIDPSQIKQSGATSGQVLAWSGSAWAPAAAGGGGGGGATVATTVAGLGTATDGKIGRVRTGSTPFSFVELVYDATYLKWVSPEIHACDYQVEAPQGASYDGSYDWFAGDNFSSGVTNNAFIGGGRVFPFRDISTGTGITSQIRHLCTMNGDGSATLKAQAGYNTANAGSAPVGTSAVTGTENTQTASSAVITRDSGWQAFSWPTVKDLIWFCPQVKTTSPLTGGKAVRGAITLRLVG